LRIETDYTLDDIRSLATTCYDNSQLGAAIASGSFRTEGMVIIPCSMKSLAAISHGYTEGMVFRIKEYKH